MDNKIMLLCFLLMLDSNKAHSFASKMCYHGTSRAALVTFYTFDNSNFAKLLYMAVFPEVQKSEGTVYPQPQNLGVQTKNLGVQKDFCVCSG